VAWRRGSRALDRLSKQHPLKYLFLEITRRCNLKCAYCGSDCSAEAVRQELPTARFVALARELAEDFTPSEVMVAITGGEPLLKPDVFELFDELGRLGFPFGMVSNGQLIDRDMARRIAGTRMGSISLSLDAPPEVNDSFRGEGSAAGVEQAVENLRAAGYQGKLEIISTVTPAAVACLDDMRRHVARLHVQLWRIAPVMPIGRAAHRPELVPGPAELRTMLRFIHDGRLDDYRPRPEFGEEGYLGDDFEGRVRPYLCQCRAGITTGGVLADGRVGACPELSNAFVQGHLDEGRFKQIWDTRYQIFRDRSWTRRDACASCDAFARCRGGSLHLYPDPASSFLRCFYLMLKQAPEP
jgi:radical SAM protein with 4Fe4S-binding SPASM domain